MKDVRFVIGNGKAQQVRHPQHTVIHQDSGYGDRGVATIAVSRYRVDECLCSSGSVVVFLIGGFTGNANLSIDCA